MDISYTAHAESKFSVLKNLGWNISKHTIKKIIEKPRWVGKSRFGQETAMDLLDSKHILRVIFNRNHDTIKIVTFHPARRGTYESTI